MSKNKLPKPDKALLIPTENIAEILRPIKASLGGANSNRLGILEMFGQSELPFLDVLEKLFPDADKTKAVNNFAKMREEVNKVAEAFGSGFRLMTDGNTRIPDSEKKVFLMNINNSASLNEIRNLSEATSEELSAIPDDWYIPPKGRQDIIKFFIVHAHKDKKAIEELLDLLKPLFRLSKYNREYDFIIDDRIISGERWKDVLDEYMQTCQFGLLMISRHMLDSDFVRDVELPVYIGDIANSGNNDKVPKPFIGICLEDLLDANISMLGLKEFQLFYWTDNNNKKRDWSGVRGNQKKLFTKELFKQIEAYVEKILSEGMPKPAYNRSVKGGALSKDLSESASPESDEDFDRHIRRKIHELEDREQYYVKPRGKLTDSRGEQNYGELENAFEEVKKWALNTLEFKPFFALLGDYGMGKTTLTRKLARELLKEYDKGTLALLPILIDLKEYEAPQPDHGLEDILSIALRKFLPANDERKKLVHSILESSKKQKLLVIYDGLDEVLVRISPAQGNSFINTLYGIAPEALRMIRESENRMDGTDTAKTAGKGKTGTIRPTNKVMVTCRTHYFRDMTNQSNYLINTRSGKTEGMYTVMELAPFDEKRITEYLVKRFGEGKGEVFKETLREIHNLLELSRRPMLLDRLCDLLDERGGKVLEKTVTTAGLYKELADFSLSRDLGKHTIGQKHKLDLMAEIAGTLNLKNVREWTADEMEEWIDKHFVAQDLRSLYMDKSMEIIKEDIRGASFLVRSGNDLFRFGHNSFFEYFLATALHRGIRGKDFRYWNIVPPSRETLDFLGELLTEEDYDAVRRSLESDLPTLAKQLLFRVLLNFEVENNSDPENIKVAFEGADFSDWRFVGRQDRPLLLDGSSFVNCRLENTVWKHVYLRGIQFNKSDMTNADIVDCDLDRADFSGTNLTGTEIRNCNGNFTRDNADTHYHFRGGLTHPPALYVGGRKIDKKTPLPDKAPAFLSGHSGWVNACTFSPDEKHALSASSDKTLALWDVHSGKRIRVLYGHSGSVNACAFSPDGKHALSASNDNTLALWEVNSGKRIRIFNEHSDLINACAFSPNGNYVLSASNDTTLALWDVYSGNRIRVFKGHSNSVHACAFSPDGKHALSASNDNTLALWGVNSGKRIRVFNGHSGSVNACAFSPDGNHALSASYDNTLAFWDIRTGKRIRVFNGHSDSVKACAFSPDGNHALSASYDNTLALWDIRSGERIRVFKGHSNTVRACAFSPDGNHALSTSSDNTLALWDVNSGERIRVFNRHSGFVLACAFSPDGKHALSASQDKTLALWDVNSGKRIRFQIGYLRMITRSYDLYSISTLVFAFSPDGNHALSASDDHTLVLWDTRTGKRIRVFNGHSDWVEACAFSPDGNHALSASDDKTLALWDIHSGKRIRVFNGNSESISACVFSPDGKHALLVSSNRIFALWDIHTGKMIRVFDGHSASVNACAFSPDGNNALSASNDKTLALWDVNSGKRIRVFNGHSDYVRACAFSPDGKYALSASQDNTLALWDILSGKRIRVFEGHSNSVLGCAFSPDGNNALSASFDSTLAFWDVNTGEMLKRYGHLPDYQAGCFDYQQGGFASLTEQAHRYCGFSANAQGIGAVRLPPDFFGPVPTYPANPPRNRDTTPKVE